MVTPEWPPTTVTMVSAGSVDFTVARNREARTTSRVVIPYSFAGLYLPAFLRTSATIGTVEFTGSIEPGEHANCVYLSLMRLTGDDEDVSVGSVVGNGLGQVADNGGVRVEQIITGHSRLSGDTSRDNNNLDILEGLSEFILGIPDDVAGGVDVTDISGNTGSTSDIVEAQGGDERVRLEEQRQRLANTTYTEN